MSTGRQPWAERRRHLVTLSFRKRLMLFTAAAIAVTVTGASLALWVVAKHELIGQLDKTLVTQAANAVQGHGPGPFGGGGSGLTLIVQADGDRIGPQAIPVTGRAQQIFDAAGKRKPYYENVTIQGFHLREFVASTGDGGGVIAVQPLDQTDRALDRIRFWILLVGAIGIGLAAALAAFVATAALGPVRRLTGAAETVAATGDLTARVDAGGSDELGRLATRFNAMLAALEQSVGAQRRLVADASHELRTPLTAARTNIDLLREGRLPEDEAKRALDEAAVELDSLTTLVADLVELARGEERKLRVEDVQLDDLVASVVERARTRTPDMTFVTALSPTQARVDPVLFERAVSNLIDNAVKWSPPGGPVEVAVREGQVVVSDHGPGIAESDLPRIFDRFYRAAAARSKPGAGLGLAIVREAALAHGGDATVESSPRGSSFTLTLPAPA